MRPACRKFRYFYSLNLDWYISGAFKRTETGFEKHRYDVNMQFVGNSRFYAFTGGAGTANNCNIFVACRLLLPAGQHFRYHQL